MGRSMPQKCADRAKPLHPIWEVGNARLIQQGDEGVIAGIFWERLIDLSVEISK